MHISELIRMGAKLKQKGSKVIVRMCKKLKGAEVMATDLRASSSLSDCWVDGRWENYYK